MDINEVERFHQVGPTRRRSTEEYICSQIFGDEHILSTKRIYIFIRIQTASENDMNEIVYKKIFMKERIFIDIYMLQIKFAV